MASREVRSIRVELPYTAGIFCDIIQQPGRRGCDLHFIQDRQIIHKERSIEKNADQIVELLVNAQIEFVSFSAVYQAGDMIVEAMDRIEHGEGEIAEEGVENGETQILVDEAATQPPTTSEVPSDVDLVEGEIPKDHELSTAEILERQEDSKEIDQVSPGEKTTIAEADTDMPLKEINVEYSQAIVQLYYDEPDEEFSVAVWDQNELKLDRAVISNDEDAILDVLLTANIDLHSMSTLYDVATEIKEIMKDPSSFLKPTAPEQFDEDEIKEEGLVGEVEEELPTTEDLREPGDVELFIEITKKSMKLERRIMLREEPIKDMKDVACQIHRKGADKWFLSFKNADQEPTKPIKLQEINLDEVARALNQGIPQISFSMLYDAAEELFGVIKRLASRPPDDMVIQQTVSHFSQIISEYESEGNVEKAQEVSAALMSKFQEMKNARGYAEFALKVAAYMDDQEKYTESAKLRIEAADKLNEMSDVHSTRDFVEKSLFAMESEKQEQFLAAAKLATRLTNFLIKEKDLSFADIALKAVSYYERADLPTSVAEYSLEFGKSILDLVQEAEAVEDSEDSEIEISEEKRLVLGEKATELFRIALDTHDNRKDRYELLESIKNIIEWFVEGEYTPQIVEFSERGIGYYEEYNEPEMALHLIEDLSIRLMTDESHLKALDFVNQAIRIYYKKKDMDSAVEMGLQVVDSLIEIDLNETAVQYLDFVQDLGNKAFGEKEPEKAQKLSFDCASRLASLGELERAVKGVRNAASSEKDPQKAARICLEQALSMLESDHLVPAQELVNIGLEILLSEGFHRDAGDLSLELSDALFDKKQFTSAMSYLEYADSCLQTSEDTGYLSQALVEHSIKFLEAQMIEKVTNLVEKAIAFNISDEEFEKGIKAHETLANKLLEMNHCNEAFIQVVKGAALFEQIEKVEEASSFLTTFRNKFLEKGKLDDARELTDLALKRTVSALGDHKTGIHIATPFIEKLVQNEDFENGYVYAVQNVRYYENLGDIESATQFMSKYRKELLTRDLYRDAAEMTSLMIRLNTRHGDTEKATTLAQEFAELMKEKDQMDLFAEFTGRISDLQRRTTGDEDEAIRTLRESAEILVTTAPEESIEVIEKIVTLLEKQDREDAINAYISYVEKLMSLGQIDVSTELAKSAVVYIKEEDEERGIDFGLDYASALIERKKAKPAVYYILLAVHNWIDEQPKRVDDIANDFVQDLLRVGEPEIAEQIVHELIVHSEDTASLTRISLRFVRQLVQSGFVQNSRGHLDKNIELLKERIKSKDKLLHTQSRIYEKFAGLVAASSPDLAREYSYRAADQYRKSKNYEGVARIHLELSKHLEPRQAIKVLKRGMDKCKDEKSRKFDIMLQKELVKRAIDSGNSKDASRNIRLLLELYEEAEELDESLFSLSEFLIKLIGLADYETAESFGEYATKLSQIIGKAAGLNTILRRLAKAYENREQTENADRIWGLIHSLPEVDSDEELTRLGLKELREPPTEQPPPVQPEPSLEVPPPSELTSEDVPVTTSPEPEEMPITTSEIEPEEISTTDSVEDTTVEKEEFSGVFGSLSYLAYQESEEEETAPAEEPALKGFSKLSSLLGTIEDEEEPEKVETPKVTPVLESQPTPKGGEKVKVGPPPDVSFDHALTEIDKSFSDDDLAKKIGPLEGILDSKDLDTSEEEELPISALRSLISSLEEDEEEDFNVKPKKGKSRKAPK